MSKVDPTQDYYAALSVAPDAPEEEIRKQYRKLALKLHPDRHPGETAEFQPRFQQIQAAHECLTDPEQRRKYDLSRRIRPTASSSSAPRPGPSGQRGNPYKASSNFPPPPRPPGAPPRKTDHPSPKHAPPPPPPRSGAERYTNFPNPPPRRAPEASSANSDAKSRANVFNAWQNMNNAQKTQAQRSQGYSVPPAWDASQADNSTAPRSAYDAVNSQQRPTTSRTSSSRVPPRPPHYQPDSPAPSGDDSSTPRQRDRPFGRANPPRMTTNLPPRVPPRAAPTAMRPEGASGGTPNEDAPFTEGSRERTPYSSTPGERTSFFAKSDSIRRTASVRDATKLDPRLDPRTGRRKSLSPPNRAANTRDANRADQPPNLRPQPAQKPSGRQWMHYSESSDSSSDDETPPRRASYAHGAAVNPADRPKASPSTSWQRRTQQASPGLSKSKSFDDQNPATANGQFPPTQQGGRPHSSIFDLHDSLDDQWTRSNTSSPRPGFTTQFSPTDGPPPVFSPTPPRVASPRHAHTFPIQSPSTTQMPPPPPPNIVSEGEESPGGGRDFRPEGWQRAFSQENWASQWAQPPHSKSTSPTRPPANSGRRNRGGVARSQAQAPPRPAATSEDIQAHLEAGVPPPTAAALDDDAMDIDETPPTTFRRPSVLPDTNADVTPSAAASAAHPHVLVDPVNSEWHASAMNTSRRASASNFHLRDPSRNPLLPPPASSSSGPDISLSGFHHVLPGSGTSSNGAGIRSLADLSSTLPFDSRPAATHPAKGPLASSDGDAGADPEAESARITQSIPRPPLAPLVPSNLSKPHWDTYLAQMSDYVTKWNAYNARMIAHFQDCAVSMADFGIQRAGGGPLSGSVMDNWLGVMGETQDAKGWESYVRELKEDGIWRAAWAVACQRHAEAVARHSSVRERLRANVERGW